MSKDTKHRNPRRGAVKGTGFQRLLEACDPLAETHVTGDPMECILDRLLFRFHQWEANLRVLNIAGIKTVPEVPWSHPFIERLIGTIRR